MDIKTELENTSKKDYLYGFGGWLILLSIGLIISFIRIVFYLIDEFFPFITDDLFKEVIAYNPFFGIIFLVELISNIGLLAFISFAAYFCFNLRKEFKHTVIYLLIFNAVMTTVAFATYLTVPETAEGAGAGLLLVFQSIIYGLIWIPYMMKSKRVNNTFVLSKESGKNTPYDGKNTFIKSLLPILFGILFETIITFTFGFNFFIFLFLSLIIAFIINSGLPIGKKYPFFRLSLIYTALLLSQVLFIKKYSDLASTFYEPSLFWTLLLIASFVFGLIGKFGKQGNGVMSQAIHGLGIILNLISCRIFYFGNDFIMDGSKIRRK